MSDTSNMPPKEKIDEVLHQRLLHARWMFGGVAAGSFAAMLTLVNTQSDSQAAQEAMALYAVALPTTCMYLLCITDPGRRIHLSRLMWVTAALGLFAFFYATCRMIAIVSTPGAWVLGVASIAMIWIMSDGETRMSKKRAKMLQSESSTESPQQKNALP